MPHDPAWRALDRLACVVLLVGVPTAATGCFCLPRAARRSRSFFNGSNVNSILSGRPASVMSGCAGVDPLSMQDAPRNPRPLENPAKASPPVQSQGVAEVAGRSGLATPDRTEVVAATNSGPANTSSSKLADLPANLTPHDTAIQTRQSDPIDRQIRVRTDWTLPTLLARDGTDALGSISQ